jgi:hypothetical protein
MLDIDEDYIYTRLTEQSDHMPLFTVDSLSKYCELTDIIRKLWANRAKDRFPGPKPKGYVGEILPWFRGARNSEHTLTPSLAREWSDCEYYKLYDRIFDLEEYYYDRFTRFGRPFLGGTMPNDEIEWNYIMRHHSIPSRLLDWTKGSLIALSYATQDATQLFSNPKKTIDTTKNAVVWMLEPRRLMETATECLYPSPIRNIASRRRKVQGMRRDFFKDVRLIEERSSRQLKNHLLRRKRKIHDHERELSNPDLWFKKEYWMYPLPLIPSHISARVGSHLSRFTLHSLRSYEAKSPSPPPKEDTGLGAFAMNAYLKDNDKFWYLVKIELPFESLEAIARVLRMTGVADMNLTQDLDGLSRELRLRAALGFRDDNE